jgi:hypothetical protein
MKELEKELTIIKVKIQKILIFGLVFIAWGLVCFVLGTIFVSKEFIK